MVKLEKEELFPYVRGCLRTAVDASGRICCFRFTEKQLAEYNKSDIFSVRAALNSGIKLDFYTDSSWVELSWELLQQAPWLDKSAAELYVNGALTKRWDFCGDADTAVQLTASLPMGMKRVTIWLNHNLDVAIRSVSIDENAVIQVVPAQKRYLALGDSITYSSALNPSMGYAMQVAEHFGWELFDQGVGGYYYDASSLDWEFPWKPDVITVAYGTNDDRTDPQAYKNRVEKYLHQLVAIWPDVPVFVIMPLWRMDLSGKEEFEWIYPVIAGVCQQIPSVTVIDARVAMPHLPELYSDGYLHPNDEGMTYYASYVIQAIKASNKIEPEKWNV